MSKELLEAKEKRIAELQELLNKSTQDCNQQLANHNLLLGRMSEAQMDLLQLKELCKDIES